MNEAEFNEYQDYVDEAEDDLDDSNDLRESQLDGYPGTYPEAREQQNHFNWFWRIVRLAKPFHIVKVGNLNNTELGQNTISVRDAMNLRELGHIFHHPSFGDYFGETAKITAATSMAKKGWFMDLSISQKKVRQRSRGGQSGEESWRVFKKGKAVEEE